MNRSNDKAQNKDEVEVEQPISEIKLATDWRSVYVASALSFVSSVQFNLFFSSLWPYLQLIDPYTSVTWFGYIISIYSLGQILASPAFGYWSNRIKQVRLPMFVGLGMMLSGNLSYLIMVILPIPIRYTLLVGRFFTGMGSGNVCLIRSYVSTASTFEDRQKAIAFVTIGHAIGVTGGPLLQLMFTPLQYPGLPLFGRISLNMYTAPAYLALLMNGFGALALYFLFHENYAGIEEEDDEDTTKIKQKTSSQVKKLPPYDRLAAAISYATRFTQMFVNTNIETIGAAFAMLMFGWTEAKTVAVTSAAQGAIGVLAFGCYVVYMTLNVEKHLSARILCIISLAALISFHLLTYSWPFLPNNVPLYNNKTINAFDQANDSSRGASPVGCDTDKYDWCFGLKSVNVWAYYAVYILCLGIAFPTLNVVQSTLFSHILGPRRQGTQQGVFQMSGGMARMIGPILMSTLYSHYGPRMAWNMEIVVIGLTLALWILFFSRMVPLIESSRARRVGDVNAQNPQAMLLKMAKS